jgi:hypothetical protein
VHQHLSERSTSSDVVSESKYTPSWQFAARSGHCYGESVLVEHNDGGCLAVALIEEELAKRAQPPTEWPDCERCGKKLENKEFKERQLTGLIGTVHWERRVGRCPDGCKIGQVAPLDRGLGLQPNQRTSAELKRAACALAVFVPFEIAVVLLKLLTEAVVSPGSIWNWVQEAGQASMERLKQQLEALKAGQESNEEEIEAATAALPLLVGADGVMVPFRPNGGKPNGRTVWREVKVAVLARLSERITRTGQRASQLVHRRLVAVLGSVDDLSPRLWLEATRQGILSAKTVVWLCDGGRGFWRLFRDRFEEHAQGILDFYHAAQNVWKGAKIWLDGHTSRSRQWFVQARHRLRQGKANEVLADLQAALTLNDLPDSARKTLQNLYDYLDAHRDHIDSARFKALGLPIGSGLVESACKWLIQQRFKGVGMRWSEDGFNHLLHLRLDWVNGRFDALFALVPSPYC